MTLKPIITLTLVFLFLNSLAQKTTDPEVLARQLTIGLKDDSSKVDTIYKWITHNIHFDYATKNQITKILNYYFNDEDLTKQFIQQIKGIKLTTCVLQKYLFENKNDLVFIKFIILINFIKYLSRSCE